ncbi:MBL fold metallo-hydrolase [Desulfocurvus sp. DL9XJH121]
MSRRAKLILAATAVCIPIGAILMTGCAIMGTSPQGEDLARMRRSPHYDTENGFENRRPGLLATMRKRSPWKALPEIIFRRGTLRPEGPLPEAGADLSALDRPSEDIRLVWFGHSSFLVQVAGINVLVDPVFSAAASPLEFLAPRFQAPPAGLDELPRIDVICISHDHYDHLDMQTVRHFRDTDTLFVTPLGVGSHLAGWGIAPQRVTELDWWQSARVRGLEFTAAPAQHFSGRGLFQGNRTLWASWAIRGGGKSVFYSGDSGYDTHFKEIGERLGPFDIAFMENGQYDELWEEVHMLPEQTIRAFADVRARRLMPVHWGMFILSRHTWRAPAESIAALADQRGIDLVTPRLGELITLDDDLRTTRWWETGASLADGPAPPGPLGPEAPARN